MTGVRSVGHCSRRPRDAVRSDAVRSRSTTRSGADPRKPPSVDQRHSSLSSDFSLCRFSLRRAVSTSNAQAMPRGGHLSHIYPRVNSRDHDLGQLGPPTTSILRIFTPPSFSPTASQKLSCTPRSVASGVAVESSVTAQAGAATLITAPIAMVETISLALIRLAFISLPDSLGVARPRTTTGSRFEGRTEPRPYRRT